MEKVNINGPKKDFNISLSNFFKTIFSYFNRQSYDFSLYFCKKLRK